MNIVELHPEPDVYNIALALRLIADDIEAGEYDFEPNLAVLVLAYETRHQSREMVCERFNWQTHGLGKDAGVFAVKGVLAAALNRFEASEDV